ncbi:MAG: aconitate hydratase AcnA [Candidatus Marsarchaeota archaeon]|jgi:aconitate hydratase|nr:aconitate hydratase AcnA [Candidatus Marsarchaeota archaeon]MCL5111679.1 aconitate hydratase AcnA [Candidatus Marsarchaeota archaeon]
MAGNGNIKETALKSFDLNGKRVLYYSIPALDELGVGRTSRLPFSIRVVLESLVRNLDGKSVNEEDVKALANWNAKSPDDRDIPFKVSRILMQDFTGVPAVVDIAAIRDYITKNGEAPDAAQPIIPTDLIIDHSVQVDAFNVIQALEINQEKEIERNAERYKLLKWASQALKNFRVFPPSAGICHQVNLEYLATCVTMRQDGSNYFAYPDTLVGTDSHTTMIDGLGVVGFGVGGIEAEAALLDQPVSFTTPKVLGVRLSGSLKDGVTATDFALTLTRLLREKGVVNMFVEFFGDGLRNLSLPDRATLSNMCPEYGATIAIFPVDEETLHYMRVTGRSAEQIELIRRYYTEQRMFDIDYSKVEYSDTLDVDLGSIEPSVSGPAQPKEQMPLGRIKNEFISIFLEDGKGDPNKINAKDYTRWSGESMAVGSSHIKDAPLHHNQKSVKIKYDDGYEVTLSDGDVVISSITSCTNTSNPSVMIGAGLLAKKAVEKGLRVNTRKVKTSLGPGSRVVTRYLQKAGLIEPLEKLGYELVGYGCITCIGNSGPLIEKQSEAINANKLAVASVLSGNRNYEARIHTDVRANYLMSPPLLVAFGIAGTVLKDLTKEPLAKNDKGEDVYLKDIWPTQAEIKEVMDRVISEDIFEKEYGSHIYNVNPYWNKLPAASGKMYAWEQASTYIRMPPFFEGFDPRSKGSIEPIKNAMVLAVFGDSISTDHISPAGAISAASPAGKYLIEHGVQPADFNSYGSRRGNHEVMMRGTFANNRIKNLLLPGTEGGFTLHYPDSQKGTIYDVAMRYKAEGVPLIVLAGLEYGSGSSRDWAAKGPMLLGVKAVVAKSFERIHRSNLVGMGIIPLQFKGGEDAQTLKADFSKPITILLSDEMKPRDVVKMRYTRSDTGAEAEAEVISRIDTPIEMEYYRSKGILNYVIKKLLSK